MLRPSPLRKLLSNGRAMVRAKLFDWRHGVDTCGVIPIRELTVKGSHAQEAVQYEPVYPEEMRAMLAALDIDFADYTFIDFGSGKGRALLIAAEFPFRAIIGVEFAKELHETATTNVERFRSATRKCLAVQCVNADATDYELPAGQVVLFFNNPFRGPVMEAVIDNVSRSLAANGREIGIVAYGRWTLTSIIERIPGISLQRRETSYSIYRVAPPNPSPERMDWSQDCDHRWH